MSTYSKARCAICHKLFYHENGTAPVCDDICCWEAYLRHEADKLEPETPLFGHVVICHRRWIPGHISSDGKPRTETVLAKRMSREPWTVLEDASRNAWWHGVNEAEGREWSDSTVESWQPLTNPNQQETAE